MSDTSPSYSPSTAYTSCAHNGLSSGVLAICLNVDYRILFTQPSDSVVLDGFEFYTTFYNSPPAIKVSFLRSLQSIVQPGPECTSRPLLSLGFLHD